MNFETLKEVTRELRKIAKNYKINIVTATQHPRQSGMLDKGQDIIFVDYCDNLIRSYTPLDIILESIK